MPPAADAHEYTCPKGRLTVKVFKRISANSKPKLILTLNLALTLTLTL